METFTPTAPPQDGHVSYPALYSQYNQSFNQPQKDITCSYCKKIIDHVSEAVVKMPCSHSAHHSCSLSLEYNPSNKNQLKCTTCFVASVSSEYVNDSDEDDGISINGNEEELEKKFGLKEIQGWIDKKSSKKLTSTNIRDIMGVTSFLKHKCPDVIDLKLIIESGITIDKLITNKVYLPQLYNNMGVREVSQLKDMGLTKKHLSTPQMNIIFLNRLYDMNFDDMKKAFNMSLVDAINICQGKPSYLPLIGLNIEGMLKNGLNKAIMIESKKYFSFNDWVNYMGLKKKHLYTLNFDSNMFSVMGWNVLKVANELKFNQRDNETFQVGIENLIPNKKKNKRNT